MEYAIDILFFSLLNFIFNFIDDSIPVTFVPSFHIILNFEKKKKKSKVNREILVSVRILGFLSKKETNNDFLFYEQEKERGTMYKKSFLCRSINQSLGDSSSSSSSRRGTVRPIYSTYKYLRGKKKRLRRSAYHLSSVSCLCLSVCLSFCLFRRNGSPSISCWEKGKRGQLHQIFA